MNIREIRPMRAICFQKKMASKHIWYINPQYLEDMYAGFGHIPFQIVQFLIRGHDSTWIDPLD